MSQGGKETMVGQWSGKQDVRLETLLIKAIRVFLNHFSTVIRRVRQLNKDWDEESVL